MKRQKKRKKRKRKAQPQNRQQAAASKNLLNAQANISQAETNLARLHRKRDEIRKNIEKFGKGGRRIGDRYFSSWFFLRPQGLARTLAGIRLSKSKEQGEPCSDILKR